MENELKTVNKNNQINKKEAKNRAEDIGNLVDSEAAKIIEELDTFSSDLDATIEILEDRTVASTEACYPIALARLKEAKLGAIKSKISVLKTLITDKGNEMAAKKKSALGEIGDLLAGVGMGQAIGAKITSISTMDNKSTITQVDNNDDFDIIDVSPQTEVSDHDIDNLLKKKDDN